MSRIIFLADLRKRRKNTLYIFIYFCLWEIICTSAILFSSVLVLDSKIFFQIKINDIGFI